MIEPGVKVLAGIGPVGSEEVGDGMSRRDLLRVVELHGHGKVSVTSRRWKPWTVLASAQLTCK
ncbi:hypothetical protein ACQRET_27525 [Streptomyces koyangensis]|uniref:hypothetical protein n=1 Tax=Streptomyces koyangensis TaxID=188770 RepID=UPI003CFECB8F